MRVRVGPQAWGKSDPRQLALSPMDRRKRERRASLNPPLTVAGLFAGIGGIELGLHRAGHRTELLCEIDRSARAVLEKRLPGIPLHDDVQTLRELPRSTELLAAGFPCQDLSQAGMTRGISGERSGLIAEVLALLERRPVPWVLLENVPFMLALGRGRALDVIVSALEQMGYRWAYRVLDSRAFGLPQRRHRVFLLATIHGDPRDVLLAQDHGELEQPPPSPRRSFGFYWTEGLRGLGMAVDAVPTLKGGSAVGIPSPPAIVLSSGRVITPNIRDAERLQGFEPDWTLPAHAVGRKGGTRWKLVGNAVTVPVAEWIGCQLRSPGVYDSSGDPPIVRGRAWPEAAWSMGQGRFRSFTSRWPVAKETEPIHRFLRFEATDLSARATAGFLGRLRAGSLRYPTWFEKALEKHRERASK